MLKQILFFCSFGIMGEVIFTAIRLNVARYMRKEPLDWGLKGHSYIWMLPIYALVPVVFPPVHNLMSSHNIIFRAFVYAVCILTVEYISGWVLKQITGKCPWEYTNKLSVHGFIRIDFLPFWMMFGIGIEFLFSFI